MRGVAPFGLGRQCSARPLVVHAHGSPLNRLRDELGVPSPLRTLPLTFVAGCICLIVLLSLSGLVAMWTRRPVRGRSVETAPCRGLAVVGGLLLIHRGDRGDKAAGSGRGAAARDGRGRCKADGVEPCGHLRWGGPGPDPVAFFASIKGQTRRRRTQQAVRHQYKWELLFQDCPTIHILQQNPSKNCSARGKQTGQQT